MSHYFISRSQRSERWGLFQMLLGGPNWPNYLIFYLFSVTEWLTFVISLLLFIHSLMNIFAQRRPSFELPIGEKRKKKVAVPIWDAIAVIPHWRITRSAQQQVQKHSFYRKIKSFLVLELSSYILSVPSFSSLCWPYFSLEFPPFLAIVCFLQQTKPKFFFMDPFSRNNLFHPF